MTLIRTLTDTDEAAAALAAKGAHEIAVCIPARDEADTIGAVVECAVELQRIGLVDDVVVVDDGSTDDTAIRAAAAGGRVTPDDDRDHGKGQALARAAAATRADILVFLDADVTNTMPAFVTRLVAPLLDDPAVQLVKPTYHRSMNGRPNEGGRVTELLARPLLRRYFPELAALVRQPLAGETAIRRGALESITLADGYGIEIALLIDTYVRFGAAAITEVDLGDRRHRNRPLFELARCADDVLTAVLERVALTSR